MTKKQHQMTQRKVASTFLTAISLLVLIISFQNCSGKHSNLSSASGPSQAQLLLEYEAEAKLVLEQNCASCHSPDSDVVSNIEDILDFAALNQNGHIIAGEPQNSPLYLAVIDGIMPHETEMLDQASINSLRDWIVALGDPLGTGGVILPPGAEPGADGSVTFSFVYNAIIGPNCAGCHNASDPVRSPLDSYAGVRAQVNYDPDDDGVNRSSPIYQEIRTGNMPPSGGLSPQQAEIILEWIRQGALNN